MENSLYIKIINNKILEIKNIEDLLHIRTEIFDYWNNNYISEIEKNTLMRELLRFATINNIDFSEWFSNYIPEDPIQDDEYEETEDCEDSYEESSYEEDENN